MVDRGHDEGTRRDVTRTRYLSLVFLVKAHGVLFFWKDESTLNVLCGLIMRAY